MLLAGFGLFVVIGVVLIALILLWSLGLGWLLSVLLPLDLFEGGLLAMLASMGAVYAISVFMKTGPPLDEDDLEDDELDPVPEERFFKTPAEKTWARWIAFMAANTIYYELEDAPIADTIEKPQQQELAARLAEISVDVLKARSPNSSRTRVSIADLKKQMDSAGLKAYDDDTLAAGAAGFNDDMAHPLLHRVMQGKLWDKPLGAFEDEPHDARRRRK